MASDHSIVMVRGSGCGQRGNTHTRRRARGCRL